MSIDFKVVKEAVSIDDVCGSYITYTERTQDSAKALCPFHKEKTPSFEVNFAGKHAGRFHCFGCGADGDIIDFVERIKHCTKPEAAYIICERHAPYLLENDNGKYKRQLERAKAYAKKKQEEEKKELADAVNELCDFLEKEGNEEAFKKVNDYRTALDEDKFNAADMYTLLNSNGANGTAERISKKYHPEDYGETEKCGRGRPPKEQKETLNEDLLNGWLKDNGITVRRNVITKAVEVSGLDDEKLSPELREEHIPIVIHDRIKSEYSCTLANVHDLLSVIAGANEFNPVLDLLANSPKWDGVDRLPEVYNALHISEDDRLSRVCIKKWFIQCISLQYNSTDASFGAEGVLVLQGAQGIGKTSCIRKLALHDTADTYLINEFREGSGTFKEGLTLVSDRDSIAQATTAWIVELGEVSGTMNKSDSNFLKDFITRSKDIYRAPYARGNVAYVRRASFYGTVNDDKFLVDETGSRRWWVVPIEQDIDLSALDALDKIQFWKQIETYSNEDRQSFRLTSEEMKLLEKRNTAFEKLPPAVHELIDIITQATAQPEKYKWIPTTTTIFKEYYSELSRYTAGKVGAAIKYVQKTEERVKSLSSVPQEEVKEYGLASRKGRFVMLPFPKTACIYSSPSAIPPDERVKSVDDTEKIIITQESLKR